MFDITKYKKIHLVGIKGVGMAALAEVLQKKGFLVSGSDVEEDFTTTKDALENLGVKISSFGESDFSGADAVIRSNAYSSENNQDVKKAEEEGVFVFSYPEVVALLFNESFGVAVAGSHGKTTTTAMLADILKKSGMGVTAIVGSKVNEWGSGACSENTNEEDSIFVLEADEYKRAFLNYKPKVAIVTSVDYDHPDCYKNEEEYRGAFLDFVKSISEGGFLVLNEDIKNVSELAENAKCKVIFYGKKNLESFKLNFPGKFNQLNANAAYLAALELGVSGGDARKFLGEFKGTRRRFEVLGQKNGLVVVDDYAHHPSEIKATLEGAREIFPDKDIIAIFQPHTYSRTKEFSEDFENAFSDADEVILTDVYSSARESRDVSVSIADMTTRVGEKAIFIKDKNNIKDYLKKYEDTNSALIFMGAGDIWQVAKNVLA